MEVMAATALAVKLRCSSWEQLASIYQRDLKRGAFFLRTQKPPSIGTVIKLSLCLPSGSVIHLEGQVSRHVTPNMSQTQSEGVELTLGTLPASVLWVIESALQAAAKGLGASGPRAAPVQVPASSRVPATPAMQGPAQGQPEARSQPAPARRAAAPDEEIPIFVATEEPEAAAAEADLIRALHAELESLRRMNPFQVLAVRYEANDIEVKEAFGELSRKYHPDRFARYESEDARSLAGEIFILVRDAYRKIGDAAARATTRATLRARSTSTRGNAAALVAQAAAMAQARTSPVPFVRAETPPSQGAPSLQPPVAAPAISSPFSPDAVLSFRSGQKAQPGTTPPRGVPQRTGEGARAPVSTATHAGTHGGQAAPPREAQGPQAGLSAEDLFGDLDQMEGPSPSSSQPMAMHVGEASDTSEAERLLEAGKYDDAMALFDTILRARPYERAARVGRELARGFKILASEDRAAASRHFEAALEIDPMNERAARELAAIRRAATESRRGLLGKLLGRKG
ncbi:MAG: DnaJ domain-containing protein [Deltaproteobacteria bacterium]|nr:DnaJ domain-containing protein [Deltaproteobacteria bacterium]